MKKLFVLILLLAMVGCDGDIKISTKHHHILCVDGVAYLQIGYAMAPKFHPDGTLYVCVTTDTKVIIK